MVADTGGWPEDPLALLTNETAELTLGCWTLKASKKSKVNGGCTASGDVLGSGTVKVTITRLS
jgi:hypothetical protein